jgi:hypothetical protein
VFGGSVAIVLQSRSNVALIGSTGATSPRLRQAARARPASLLDLRRAIENERAVLDAAGRRFALT